MRRAAPVAATLLFGVVAGACGLGKRLDNAVWFPTTKPADADLVGRWRIRPSSIPETKAWYGLDAKDAEIVLAADGTLTLRQVPDGFIEWEKMKNPRLADQQGRWSLAQFDGAWQLGFVFDRPAGVKVGTFVWLWNKSKPYAITLTGDDPDSCRFVYFDRDADGPDAVKTK